MTIKKLIFAVVTMTLLLSLLVFAQKPRPESKKHDSHLKLIEAEIAVKLHELLVKNSELERMVDLVDPLTDPSNPVFDAKRMAYGGFQWLVRSPTTDAG